MEKISIENGGSSYNDLKRSLLDGSISLEEIRDRLLEIDQADLSREGSEGNLVFLYDKEIVAYIDDHPEHKDRYQSFLSFTEFHVAQREATENPKKAIEHFKKALENSQGQEAWEAYIQGTLLYIQGEQIPEELIEKVDQSKNARVLKNLNAGLKQRGFPSYSEDYFQ